MRTIRTCAAALLCFVLLLSAFACQKQGTAPKANATVAPTAAPVLPFDIDAAVLTIGDVPVSALVYRYQLQGRYNTIQKNNLFDRETYLSYVVNPSIYYPYPYRDTRTAEGLLALQDDVLNELSYEAASIYAARKKGYTLTIEDQNYILQARQDAEDALSEATESYASVDAFYAETGFDKTHFIHMYEVSREASIDFNKLLDAYRKTAVIDDETLESGYARIVKETFADRYTDGMYSQYLAHYITGARSYPSLYIPDDAIFVRLFVHTNPTAEQITRYTAAANEDFNALYMSRDNEFLSQGTVGDIAVAPKDSLVEGLYDAAKDVPLGAIGTMTREQNGKTLFYLFLRVEGETGIVPIDRYPGVRERIVNQLFGATYMEYLMTLINDPAITVRDEALLKTIGAEIGA